MKKNSFIYSFTTSKSAEEVFELLSDIPQWWSGLFNETITGKSEKLNDEFTFNAGGGVHYSKQKLSERIPNKKLVWEVTDSNLSFLKDTGEWTNSKISFDISAEQDFTKVTFTHEGLVPEIECYSSCTNAWTQYLENLKQKLNESISV